VSGDWTVSFKFYAQAAGGVPFFAETRDVKPELGVFAAILGTKTDNPLNPVSFQGGEAWLELSVAPKGGVGITLQPRQRVVSHPYALWTSGAEQCKQADNALSFGGAAPTAYVTLAALPQLCITDETLAAKIEALGLESYGDADVAAYLLANGYVPGAGGGASSWDDLTDKPEGLLTEASAAASGLFLMADGSVVATGDLDLGGNQLLNVVIENASAADAPAAPISGQLWYDTDENVLKVYGDGEWLSLGDASNLACDGCVDPADVSFDYALGGAKGGAALKALALECEDCVTLGALAPDVLVAGNIAFDDSAAGLGAATVGEAVETLASQTSTLDGQVDGMSTQLATLDQRVETLENTGPGNINEGNGTVVSYSQYWTMQPQGKVRQNFHIFNPTATPKVLLYLNSGDPEQSGDLIDKTVASAYGANAYANVTTTALVAATSIAVSDGSLFKKNDPILVYQIVTGTGSPAGTWELAQVKSVVGNTLLLFGALQKTYVVCGNDCGVAQVVRVERYRNFYVESGGNVYPSDDLSGDEKRGGIVAIIADTITVKNGGTIQANGYGFESGDWHWGENNPSERGHSECNINETSGNAGQGNSCSGGGGDQMRCCTQGFGAGGGGNKTAGGNGQGSYPGTGGASKGTADLATIHYGGGGGAGWPHQGGSGGGIVILAAKTVSVEAGGLVEANGNRGDPGSGSSSNYGSGGGGAGGTVAIFAGSYSKAGTVRATGGAGGVSYSGRYGGGGGEGWVVNLGSTDKFVLKSLPSKVKLLLDGTDITKQVGDPNAKGAPTYHATDGWGNGVDQWETGELDVTSLGNWTLGPHKLEVREDGGAGGILEMALYLIYPFTASTVPTNDTCTKPKVLEVMDGAETLSDTTEDTMGRIKAIDDYVQAGCGGSGGPDTVYKLDLTDWRKLTINVTAAFTPRVYVRKGDCTNGALMACGAATTVTPDLKTGTYYLFVDGDGNLQKGNFKLDLKADLPSPAANDTCPAATTLTLDENGKAEVYGVTFFSKDDLFAGCGGVGAKDLVYRIVIPNGYETLKATVETTDFVPAVYMTNSGCGGSWITCSPTKVATLSWPAAGTYYIVVDGKTAADQGEFTLKVEMIAPM
jgi:hypothetical protein